MCAPAAACGSIAVDPCCVETATGVDFGCLVSRPRKKPAVAAPSARLTLIITINPVTASDAQSRLFRSALPPTGCRICGGPRERRAFLCNPALSSRHRTAGSASRGPYSAATAERWPRVGPGGPFDDQPLLPRRLLVVSDR